MTKLTALIVTIEEVIVGGRELDAMIWAATLPTEGIGIDGYGLPSRPSHYEYAPDPVEEGDLSMSVVFDDTGESVWRATRTSPHFSTSIDAALTLVPAGHDITITQASGPGRTDWYATCVERRALGNPLCPKGNAYTAPLALCIAALRARSSHG